MAGWAVVASDADALCRAEHEAIDTIGAADCIAQALAARVLAVHAVSSLEVIILVGATGLNIVHALVAVLSEADGTGAHTGIRG